MDALPSNPFGQKPNPLWRRALLWINTSHVPKPYAAIAGAVGPIAALFLTAGDGLDKATRLVIVASLTTIPPVDVEVWWRARERRRAGHLAA